jgi:uncharacterized membrane protein YccC
MKSRLWHWPRLRLRPDRQALHQALRTTVAAVLALLAARLCRLPESYWAPITTIVVMQSTLGAAWDISWQRLLGTLLGCLTAAALVTILKPGPIPFVLGMLLMAILCAFLPEQRSAYRFAGITLAVVMLPHSPAAIWMVALHRFLEVTVGIVVAMAVTAVWAERITGTALPLPPKHRD